MKITKDLSTYLNDAHAYFDEHLFGNSLKDAMVTVSRRKGAFGYFFPSAFNKNGIMIDEIALTPSCLGRTSIESLSTLVHEEVHQWIHHHDKPAVNGYHTMQWAKKMLEVGLKPYCITDINKMTGYKCSHDIISGGKFEEVVQKFINFRGEIPLATSNFAPSTRIIIVKKRPSVTCPSCKKRMALPKGLNITITCNDCGIEME